MNKRFKFILGIQSYTGIDSGACIFKVDSKSKKFDYVAISEKGC